MSQSDPASHPPLLAERVVTAREVRKSFGTNDVLNGIDLDVRPSTVTVLLGPSGSGKTTFLRALNALEPPDSGTIRVNDVEVDFGAKPSKSELARLRGESGFVFQSHNLFPHLTVLRNVTLGPTVGRHVPAQEAEEIALRILERVGLADKAHSYPWQLSGGQQQRVGIARALALRPSLVLLDEPTSALDPELVGEVKETISEIARDGQTLVIVTHEIQFARTVADQVVFIDGGVVVERGTPSEVLVNPTHERTRRFLARILNE